MSAPALAVQQQGLGVATADNLNTYQQTCDNLAQLRAFIGVQGVMVFLRGYVSPNDGGQGAFFWQVNATGPDNGTTIIMPTGSTVGAWVRIVLVPTLPGPNTGPLYTGLILTWTPAQTVANAFLGGERAEIAYVIPQNLPGSYGLVPQTEPSGNYVVTIKKNATVIATATYVLANHDWTFACAADVAIAIGDSVRFFGAGDVAIVGFGLTLKVKLA